MKLGQTQLRDKQIKESVDNQVKSQVWYQLSNRVWYQVSNQVYDKLYEQVRGGQISFQTKQNILI